MQVKAEDGPSGLARAEFPAATSVGGVYTTALEGGYQYTYTHPYAFASTSTEEGTYQVAVYDRATNQTVVTFTVRRDTTPPTSTTSSPEYDNWGTIPVTWTAGDDVSGLGEARLWYKFNAEGIWAAAAVTGSGESGVFAFTPPEGDGAYFFAAVATDNVGNGETTPTGSGDDSTIYDTTPPTSSASSPATSESPDFVVTWSGSDALSGVASYDVQVRVDEEVVWQAWQEQVTHTQATYHGEGGHTYHFRSRARDAAGNEEAWPTQPDTSTEVLTFVTKYYYHAGRRVAMRAGDVV